MAQEKETETETKSLIYEQYKMASPNLTVDLNLTSHHMDAYLAIPQVVMEWIVEPG
jgi:hypothetical protein